MITEQYVTFKTAKLFAAKEAVSKCFGTGIGVEISWKSVSVSTGKRGEPGILLDEKGRNLLEKFGGLRIIISLSHTQTLAIATAAMLAGSKADGRNSDSRP